MEDDIRYELGSFRVGRRHHFSIYKGITTKRNVEQICGFNYFLTIHDNSIYRPNSAEHRNFRQLCRETVWKRLSKLERNCGVLGVIIEPFLSRTV